MQIRNRHSCPVLTFRRGIVNPHPLRSGWGHRGRVGVMTAQKREREAIDRRPSEQRRAGSEIPEGRSETEFLEQLVWALDNLRRHAERRGRGSLVEKLATACQAAREELDASRPRPAEIATGRMRGVVASRRTRRGLTCLRRAGARRNAGGMRPRPERVVWRDDGRIAQRAAVPQRASRHLGSGA
jgi:hypothetical protein